MGNPVLKCPDPFLSFWGGLSWLFLLPPVRTHKEVLMWSRPSLLHIWTVSTVCLHKVSARGPVWPSLAVHVAQSCSLGEALSCLWDCLRMASIHYTSGGVSMKSRIPAPAANQAASRRCHLALPGDDSSNCNETFTQPPSPFLSLASWWVCSTWQPNCRSQRRHLPGQQCHPSARSSYLFIQVTVTSLVLS